GEHHTAQEVQGGGIRVEQGRGRAAYAVFQGIPAAVLCADDGRDRDRGVAGGGGDGDARGQREPGGGANHAGGAGEGDAFRDPRGRPHRRRRRLHGDY